MTSFKPFSYLWRWFVSDKQVVTAEQRLQNLALWQIVSIGLIGASIFTLASLSLFGCIELQTFAIGCAFFMGLLIAFCWWLVFIYEVQRKARMLGLAHLWIYRVLFIVSFFAACYSPLLPPPRFLA